MSAVPLGREAGGQGALLGATMTALVTATLLVTEEIFALGTAQEDAAASFLALLIAACLGAVVGVVSLVGRSSLEWRAVSTGRRWH